MQLIRAAKTTPVAPQRLPSRRGCSAQRGCGNRVGSSAERGPGNDGTDGTDATAAPHRSAWSSAPRPGRTPPRRANGLWTPPSSTRSRGAITAAAAAPISLRRRSPAARAVPAPRCPAAAAAPCCPPGARPAARGASKRCPPGARPAARGPNKRCSPGARPTSRAANKRRPPGARPAARSPCKRCPPGARGRPQRCPPADRLRPHCSPPGRCPASPRPPSARPSRAPAALWPPAGPRCCPEASRFRPAHFPGDATCRWPIRWKCAKEDWSGRFLLVEQIPVALQWLRCAAVFHRAVCEIPPLQRFVSSDLLVFEP